MAKAKPPVEKLQSEIDPESDLYGLLYDPFRAKDWIETFLTIPNEKGTVVPFILRPQQNAMDKNQTYRDNTIKARQTTASSFLMARNTRRMTTGFGLNCFVMADKERTINQFRKRIEHHLTDLRRAGFDFNIVLNNDKELVIGGLENRFIWASAEERVTGRGYSIQIAHLSEVAHYRPETEGEIIGGILPAVPDPPDGWLDMESTPKGADGLFYDMIQGSRPLDPQGLSTAHLYPWWMEPRYTVDTWDSEIGLPAHYHELVADMRRDFTPTAKEQKLIQQDGLSVGQILWRRLKQKQMALTATPFLQEFVEDYDTCFMGTGDSFFTSEDGIDHLSYHRENRLQPLEIREQLVYRSSPVSFHGRNFVIWELPQPGTPYAMYQDTSKGGTAKDSDPSVITVMNAVTRHIVSRLTVKATPREIAEMGCSIGQFYNMALYGGERDAWGAQALERVRELTYPNVHYHVDYQRKSRDVAPWIYPTQENRNMMLLKFREWVFDHSMVIKDSVLLNEMGAFTWQRSQTRDTWKAQGKRLHDDHVLSAAGACVVAERAALIAKKRPSQQVEELVLGKFGQVIRRGGDPNNRPRPWFR